MDFIIEVNLLPGKVGKSKTSRQTQKQSQCCNSKDSCVHSLSVGMSDSSSKWMSDPKEGTAMLVQVHSKQHCLTKRDQVLREDPTLTLTHYNVCFCFALSCVLLFFVIEAQQFQTTKKNINFGICFSADFKDTRYKDTFMLKDSHSKTLIEILLVPS